MTTNKLVSIGVPVYNEQDYIEKCLESIVSDMYPHKEIIISDNSSTDDTWSIIQNFKNKYGHIYDIHIFRQEENRGALYNFNYVLKESRGEYFVWLGAHDLWGEDLIKKSVSVIEMSQDTALVAPLVKWIDEDSNVLDKSHVVIDTRLAHSPAGRVHLLINQWKECTAIYGLHRKSILLNTIPWPTTLGSDNIVLARIARQGNIVPIESGYYFRRVREPEREEDRIERQLRVMHVKGISYNKPRTMYHLRLLYEAIIAKGSLRDRIGLTIESFRQLGRAASLELTPMMRNLFKKTG